MNLSPDERQYLLQIARESIEHAAQDQESPPIDPEDAPASLQRDGASFVTLTEGGRLRGCIGSLEAERPLVLDVQKNAVNAALHDPRFPPVQPGELDELQVEVSVLSIPEPLSYEDADDLTDQLRPGVDGVVIERGWHRGTFLPQVWEKLPQPKQFLRRLCQKAGLPANAYRSGDLDVYTYQVEKFTE
jgi:AmmeMemoRadiSam system protein A